VSIALSGPLTACAWCGLLSEAEPVCTICGSPVLDTAGWTTVLDVTWPLEPPTPARDHPHAGHQWVSLEQVAELFRIPELNLRSWLEEAPEGDEPRLLLIEPGVQAPPKVIWAPHPAEPEPSMPSLWIAPMPAPQPFRLEAAWAFQPTERERRLFRLEMLRARGATILAVGLGAGGAIYLIDHALR
jgi:hypothetical protein